MADLIENCRRHRVMIGLLTVLGALLLGARAQQQEFRLVGSDVTLVPKYTGDLKEITWLLDDRIFVEIVLKPQEETLVDLTNDRTTINKANGALTIRYLTIEDSGLYRAEALAKSTESTEIRLTVHGCPDQPTISVESTEDQFVVSCKSFSPDVTYEWFNQTRSVSKSQSYAEHKKHGNLTCVVHNKVCNKRSSVNFYIPAQPEEKSVGYDVTLVPQYTGDPSEIIWKVNGYKLVEMVLKPQVNRIFYRLQDRANISDTDGSLTIRHLTMEDFGVYTAVVLVNNNEYYYTEIRLKSRPLSGGDIAGIVIGGLAVIIIIIILLFLLQYYYYKKKIKRRENLIREMTNSTSKVVEFQREEESERCITVMFWNDKSQPEESRRLLENRSKGTQSLTLYGVESVGKENFTAEVVMSDRKEDTFTDGKKNKEKESDTKHVKELVWKKNDVTIFKWANSSLKFHASNIKLKRESVTVKDAEGKKSYKVFFRLEGHPESTSIYCITFHPSNMTGKDPITWEKDSQPVNIEDNRIKCEPNGDLTIYNATSEDKGKYTVQCIDNERDQEFILHL